MYASSPGLNGMEHPLYDVWVINCSNGAPNTPVAAMSLHRAGQGGVARLLRQGEHAKPFPEEAGQLIRAAALAATEIAARCCVPRDRLCSCAR